MTIRQKELFPPPAKGTWLKLDNHRYVFFPKRKQDAQKPRTVEKEDGAG